METNSARSCWPEANRAGWAADKATLLFGGEPLWSIQIKLLQKLDPIELLVSARTDPPWRPQDARFVADTAPSRGPLSGLAASLAHMQGTHLLALAIDMPFMTEAHLNFVLHQTEPSRGVLPMIGSRAEPLAAIYPREALPDFEEALARQRFFSATNHPPPRERRPNARRSEYPRKKKSFIET